MSLSRSIIERMPEYIPTSTIIVDDTRDVTESSDGSVETVYQLEKAPFKRVSSVTARVDGITTDLDVSSDIDVLSTDSTLGPGFDSIEFVNPDLLPDVGTEFTVEYRTDPVILEFMETFDSDLESVGDSIDTSIASKYIDEAPGESLDLIGSAFGEIGRRRRRTDAEYRGFLRSIVRAFNANGTIGDIKFAVASALRGRTDDVRVEEDFEQTGFRVYIDTGDSEVLTDSLNDLIDLSSPTGVELLRPPVLQTGDTEIGIVGGGSVVASREDGLSSSTLDSGSELE